MNDLKTTVPRYTLLGVTVQKAQLFDAEKETYSSSYILS